MTEESTENSTPVPASDQEGSVWQFVHSLPKLLVKSEFRNHLRITPRGVFVKDDQLSDFLDLFRNWFKEHAEGHDLHDGKAVKKLFGSSDPHLYYLLEGKTTLKGHLVELALKQPQNMNLPFYLGSLIDAASYLHPNDPALQNLEGIKISQASTGISATFNCGGKSFSASQDRLTEFLRLAEHSPRTTREFPDLNKTRVDLIKAFHQLLRKARIKKADDPLIIPSILRGRKDCSFYRVGGYVISTARNGEILKLYDLKGSNFYYFLRTELSELLKSKRAREIADIELYDHPGKSAGRISSGGRRYNLSMHSIGEFVTENFASKPSLTKECTGLYTLRDAINEMTQLFRQSVEVSFQEVRRYIPTRSERSDYFRSVDKWIFRLDHEHSIQSVFLRRLRQSKPTNKFNRSGKEQRARSS